MAATMKCSTQSILMLVGVMLIAGVFNPPPVSACGYEDPNSAAFQRGVLGLSYPKALYVLGALTQAQLDRTIPSEPAPSANYLLAYLKTALILHRFGDALQDQQSEDNELAFTLVLIEPMLWTRFLFDGGHATTFVHVDGPQPGDFVIVTAETALRQIVDHRMTIGRAEELGLIRIYGEVPKVTRVRKAIEFRWNDLKPESLLRGSQELRLALTPLGPSVPNIPLATDKPKLQIKQR